MLNVCRCTLNDEDHTTYMDVLNTLNCKLNNRKESALLCEE